mmetsp:Transcript_14351/g.27328  ORF Transcript_14351/g.27328 Transcript_14351/m.27328 type:complete len:268 (-) Transcript_14351:202-1005(-)
MGASFVRVPRVLFADAACFSGVFSSSASAKEINFFVSNVMMSSWALFKVRASISPNSFPSPSSSSSFLLSPLLSFTFFMEFPRRCMVLDMLTTSEFRIRPFGSCVSRISIRGSNEGCRSCSRSSAVDGVGASSFRVVTFDVAFFDFKEDFTAFFFFFSFVSESRCCFSKKSRAFALVISSNFPPPTFIIICSCMATSAALFLEMFNTFFVGGWSVPSKNALDVIGIMTRRPASGCVCCASEALLLLLFFAEPINERMSCSSSEVRGC